jgi:exonuclease III
LASQYSRKNFRQGGVCIFINKNVQFSKINNVANCKEKDLELCAIQLISINVCIVCVYRAPSGDFPSFLKNIEDTLNKLYRNLKNIIICGDVNINYLTNNNYK